MSLLKNIKDVIQGKAKLGHKRSSKWPKIRAEHLKHNPSCNVCEGTKTLEVHHIKPFHLDPSKELDPTNLITLCESKLNGINCHLAFGHLGNFKFENESVIVDAAFWNKKLKTRKQIK